MFEKVDLFCASLQLSKPSLDTPRFSRGAWNGSHLLSSRKLGMDIRETAEREGALKRVRATHIFFTSLGDTPLSHVTAPSL